VKEGGRERESGQLYNPKTFCWNLCFISSFCPAFCGMPQNSFVARLIYCLPYITRKNTFGLHTWRMRNARQTGHKSQMSALE